MATRRRSARLQTLNPSPMAPPANPSPVAPPADPSPDSPPANPSPVAPPADSDSFFLNRTRVAQFIDYESDPSAQEIAEYTLLGGNLSAIDAYARGWSRDGEGFSSYERLLKRIFRYYRDFLAQRNRARFEEETPETGDEGESSLRSNRQ